MKNVFPDFLENIVATLCADTATPRSLAVFLLMKNGEWDQLANLEVDPRHYSHPISYLQDVACTSFLRKMEDLPTTIDRPQVALDNFWKSEKECCSTNLRLLPYLRWDRSDPTYDEGIARVLRAIRKKVSQVLGPCPDLVSGKFGPGATFADRGQLSTVPDKMSSRPTLTTEAFPFLFQWSGTAWASACAASGRDPEFVRGNRFTTVPKDCRKHRGIAVEPSINVFYQLSYGGVIRSRLKKEGLDLLVAQDIHRRVACEASIRGHLATIDLSNASDTVSNSLVKLLLPPRWFEVLSALRSPATLVKGKWVLLEKFSSMGNGFTFELETLLFYAISSVVMAATGTDPLPGENVLVFGDDIIIPTESARSVIAALRFLGFTPNVAKSFVSGPFRESCGGDFFNGYEVRPYYLKESPREPQQYIAMANGLYRLGRFDLGDTFRSSLFRRSWFRILDAIPSDIRKNRGPQGLGDLVIHDSHEFWQTRWRNSMRYIRVYRVAGQRYVGWQHFRPEVVLASAVYGAGDGLRGALPRKSVTGYKNGWYPFS